MYKWALFVFATTAAFAQNDESWVATYGSDSNACTLASPCRTFNQAINSTNSGGTIRVLNAGDYGPAIISKSLTLDGGGFAVIESSGVGLSINVASATVTIRNLTFHGAGGGGTAINAGLTYAGLFLLAPVLNLENITAAASSGVVITIGGQGGAQVNMRNVSVLGGSSGVDLYNFAGQTSPILATIEGLTVKGALQYGLVLTDCSAVIRDSVFDANGIGIQHFLNSGQVASLLLDRTEMSFNATDGLQTTGGSTVRLSNSTITGNATGIDTSAGGTVISFRNNVIAGNTVDNPPALATSLR